MTVEEARKQGVCRVCGAPIPAVAHQPKGWQSDFGEVVWPLAITLKFGEEFAHTACLPEAERLGRDGP